MAGLSLDPADSGESSIARRARRTARGFASEGAHSTAADQASAGAGAAAGQSRGSGATGGQDRGDPNGSHSAPRSSSTPAGSAEEQLVEKLRRIEALHARAGSEGERVAAERARQRIQQRLQQLETSEPPIEYRFSMADQWSRHLFTALLRRYGITPYRYRGQRRTTVMARLSRSFVNDTLWPEFEELQSTLATYFDALTARVIEQALEVKAGEAEERPPAPQLQPVDHQGSLLDPPG